MRINGRALSILVLSVGSGIACSDGSGPSAPETGIPASATYDITIDGMVQVGSGSLPFRTTAVLLVVPTLDPKSGAYTRNGVNPRDLGIFTAVSPLAGTAGALWFGSNTSLGPGGKTSASNVDVSIVTIDTATNRLQVEIDGTAFGLPNARNNSMNIYNTQSSIITQIQNVLAGGVIAQFSNGGRNVTGRIQIGGSSGIQSGVLSSIYGADFSGTRN